jgi:hypothetical protein
VEFTQLERDVLNWIATHCNDANIMRQLQNIRPISREYTGHGFFVKLELLGEHPKVAHRVSPVDPHIDSPELDEYGGGCVLFFEDGRTTILELYANGESFPEHLTSWKLI